MTSATTALQHFKVGTLNIEIHPDLESAGKAAAQEAAQALAHLAQSADEFGVIFATGASQLSMLDALTSMPDLPTAIARPASTNGWRREQHRDSSSMPRIAFTAKPATSRIRTAISPGFRRRAAAGPITRQCDHDCVTGPSCRPRYRHSKSLLRRDWRQLGQSRRSICNLVSLRLSAKSGIVGWLDAPIGFAFEIDH